MTIRKLSSALLFLLSCIVLSAQTEMQPSPYNYVNPFIGTGGHGHTYPGATVPHGAVQLSPDTRKGNWDACSGYHYNDNTLLGFSHTHLSGTGCADLADVLIRPCSEIPTFSHSNEVAQPGYYSVTLDNGIFCELTATTYCGMHHYVYPEGTNNIKLILDLGHVLDNGGYAKECEANETGPNEISGMRRTHSWVNNRYVYFCIRFDRSFDTTQSLGDYKISSTNEQIVDKKMEINFFGQHELTFKVGISFTSTAEAKKNMEHDVKGFDFGSVKFRACADWERELGRVQVDGGTEEQRQIFYTSLYHSLVVPNIISDADAPKRIYSTFSNWDTFRAWNPLMTILDPELENDIVNSMLAEYDNLGHIAQWSLQGMDTKCMVGYHSASIIWDAYQKGINNFDAEKALTALVATSERYGRGMEYYNTLGYFANDVTREAVSETMEIAYDDWCIAMLANALGHKDIYDKYIQRSRNYANVFDGRTRFFRGKSQTGGMSNDFNCYQQTADYTEATPWQYRFFVPHDVNGMVQMFGGKDVTKKMLDSLFTVQANAIDGAPDITGLIGQYAHGNEPSHNFAFLYSYLGYPEMTDYYVSRIQNELYHNTPDGIAGNEDCGELSAWYVLTAMGIFQMCPGSGVWNTCKPLFSNIRVNGLSVKDYVLSEYKYNENQWFKIVSIPYCNKDLMKIDKKENVSFGCVTEGAEIYYTTNGKTPTKNSKLYTKPFHPKGHVLCIRAFKDGYAPSPVQTLRIK